MLIHLIRIKAATLVLLALAFCLLGLAPVAQASATFTKLVSFNYTNGLFAVGLIQASDGNFYGTTYGGGVTNDYGPGTIFRMTPDGQLTTLYQFYGTNGENPTSGLVQDQNGDFYGTTIFGGNGNLGTIYRLTADGNFTNLLKFNGSNGAHPAGRLMQGRDGNFYGTTQDGGFTGPINGITYPGGLGTLFQLTTNGALNTLLFFNFTNGASPRCELVQSADGSIYGTTSAGGVNNLGTVFKFTTNGLIQTLFSFNYTNGAAPTSRLLQDTAGNLFGSTFLGGAFNTGTGICPSLISCTNGYGTIFKLATNGTLTTLHFFDGTNGANPNGDLMQGADGNLFGLTQFGGPDSNNLLSNGNGTIFELTTNNTFVTQVFCHNTNASPTALIQANDGDFYGTTAGTVFTLSNLSNSIPGNPPTIYFQPLSRTNTDGTTANFSVTACGTEPMIYRWQRQRNPLSNGGNISGADTATLTLTNVSFGDESIYSVIISNAFGSVTSSLAALKTVRFPFVMPPFIFQTNYTPLFEYAVFYNSLLEFSTAATFTITDRVHANGEIYVGSSSSLTFNSDVTCTGAIRKLSWAGTSVGSMSGAINYNGYVGTNVSAITLPIGTNNTANNLRQILYPPPAGESLFSNMGHHRFYNLSQFNIIISNNSVSAWIKNIDLINLTTNAVASIPWTSLTNFMTTNNVKSFYDQREGAYVGLTQIDIGKYNTWGRTNTTVATILGKSLGFGAVPNDIWIADYRTTNSTTGLYAIRLTNGAAIPTNNSGLTLATPNPLYVLGNFNVTNSGSGLNTLGTTNTTTSMPCALYSDALTILSQNWTDASSTNTYAVRMPVNTTVNAAIVAGSVYSTGSGVSQYSGGAHNFVRLLEYWPGHTLTLNTSLVNLFNSVQADGLFIYPGQSGTYYYPPTRQYSHDARFENADYQPPGTPYLTGSFVANPVIITNQPQSQIGTVGQSVTFTVGATNYYNHPLTYQWYYSTNIPLANATNASLTLTNIQDSNAGNYKVIVTDDNQQTLITTSIITNITYIYLGKSVTSSVATLFINHPPTADNVTYSRKANAPLTINIADLMTNVTDADGDWLTFGGLVGSTNGATLTTNSSQIIYQNSAAANDQFSYTVTDGNGGSATGLVTVVMYPFIAGRDISASVSGGSVNWAVPGIAGYSYVVERSTNLTEWSAIATNSADTNGVISITDPFNDLGDFPNPAFYRLQWHP